MDHTYEELRFHPITAADQPALLSLMKRIYPPVYAYLWPDGGDWYVESQYGSANVARELADPVADYRFMVWGGEPVGILRFVPGLPLADRPDSTATKLHRLYLDPAVQGRGIGRGAIAFVEEACRTRGEEWLWLEAMDSAPAAISFYERLGFRRVAPFTLEMPRMLPRYRGMWRMAKPL